MRTFREGSLNVNVPTERPVNVCLMVQTDVHSTMAPHVRCTNTSLQPSLDVDAEAIWSLIVSFAIPELLGAYLGGNMCLFVCI